MDIFAHWRKPKKLKIDYVLDAPALVARVYVNLPEEQQTEDNKKQVEALVSHFQHNLQYTVMVEER